MKHAEKIKTGSIVRDKMRWAVKDQLFGDGSSVREWEKIEEADIDNLRDAGWSDQAIEDAIGVIALYAFVNRLVEGIGIKGSPEYFQYIGTSFAQKGYGQLVATAKKKAA